MGPAVTCQRRFRRFLALFLRVVVSLIRFHNSPGESFLFTTSRARVAQNAHAVCFRCVLRYHITR